MGAFVSRSLVRTVVGYVATLLRNLGVLKLESASIEHIYNHVAISRNLRTSGQPSAADLRQIKAAGFRTIINLAPHHAENALENEAEIVDALGLAYIHIPVDFRNPTATDFAKFVETMNGLTGTDVWIHCAANMRVSAFVYRYRRDVLKESEEVARRDLVRIWEPFGVWAAFVASQEPGE
jgi:uncharacterized protein (TIGR01244 family)